MPQYNYTRQTAFNGQECDGFGPRMVKSYTNERLAQISEITFSDFDVGTYTIRLRNIVDGREIDIATTGPGGTIAATVAAVVASFDAEDGFDETNLLNIASASNTSPSMTLEFIHPGEVWEISFPSNPGPGNMTNATTQAAGGTNVGVGVFVVRGSEDDLAKAPVSGSADVNFVGLTIRNTECSVVDYTTAEPVFEPADTMSVKAIGRAWVLVENAVSAGSAVYARKVSGTNGTVLGKPRSDADGGNAVLITNAFFVDSTTGAGFARISLNRAS